MDIQQALLQFAHQPLTHQLLVSLLKGYKRPNDKIHELIEKGVLATVKKGLYTAGVALNSGNPEPFLVANHILGPSYVSLDSALSYYGLIPERVYEISSMTPKSSRKFATPMGVFSYSRLPLPYYSFGIASRAIHGTAEQTILIASPEKALCDKVVTTPGVILRSTKNTMEYLLNDLRIDEVNIKELNTTLMNEWIPEAPKKDSLAMLIKTIQNL